MQFPADFIAQMNALLGETELSQLLLSIEEATPVSIRYNPLKTAESHNTIDLAPITWADHAYYLPKRPSFTSDPLFHAGQYYVQEAASMFLAQAFTQCLDLTKPLQVLDLCAAPGGKSTLIASLISSDSLLVSNEVIRSRAHILSENIQKWGSGNVWVSNNDPQDFGNKLPSFFDVVVVDAPCSGEGMFRKTAHSIEEWSLKAVQHCALRQQRILHDVWAALRPGGLLIYSTCTYNETENEDNLLAFREDADFDALQLQISPEWNITETTKDGLFGYRFYPHKTKGEGFFLAILKKAGDAAIKIPKVKKTIFGKVEATAAASLEAWIQHPNAFHFLLREDHISAIRLEHRASAEVLSHTLRLLYGGLELGIQTRKGINPTPAAALFSGLNHQNFSCIDLDLEKALSYLRLDPLPAGIAAPIKDWQLIRYKELGLGWVKRIDHRLNNSYPKEWKIRLSLDKLI